MCFYNPSDTRMREGSSVQTFPVFAKMSEHPPNAALWGQGLYNITEKHQHGKFQPDPSAREGHSLQKCEEFGAIAQSSWRLLLTRPVLVITAWDCLGKKGKRSFSKGRWEGRMQGFCSLNVYKPQDCVAKTPQKKISGGFPRRGFRWKCAVNTKPVCLHHATLQPGINKPFVLSSPSK